jgi:hypothetical protein
VEEIEEDEEVLEVSLASSSCLSLSR